MSQTRIQINSAKDAASLVERVLASLNIETHKHPIHHNKSGTHIYLKNVKTGKVYHIKFAREPFITFGYIFRQHKGKVGETLDKEVVDSLQEFDELIFAYPHAIYCCSVGKFREHALQRVNDADNYKVTLSVPIDILDSFL